MQAIDTNPLDILEQKKYKPSQAAAMLGMSKSKFNRLCLTANGPNEIRIAGKRRFLHKELERWLIDQNPNLKEQFIVMEQIKSAFKKQREKNKKIEAAA